MALVAIVELVVMRSRFHLVLETTVFACRRVFRDRVQLDVLHGMTQSTATTVTYSYMA